MFFEISIISFNSSIDSAFNCLIFLLIANSISSFCFPTPENIMSFGLTETFKHLFNSPIDTTSAPAPRLFIYLIYK